MTQEEKQLLLKDLSARLIYKPFAYKTYREGTKLMEGDSPLETDDIDMLSETDDILKETGYTIKPYLRPMSSMTEEEKEEIRQQFCYEWEESVTELMYCSIEIGDADYFIDWLNEHHFDYRGLIEKGLALEAPEGMYKTE